MASQKDGGKIKKNATIHIHAFRRPQPVHTYLHNLTSGKVLTFISSVDFWIDTLLEYFHVV